MRRGMGKGKGKGYKNLIGRDKKVHSDSAKGRKQPQRLNKIPLVIKPLVTKGKWNVNRNFGYGVPSGKIRFEPFYYDEYGNLVKGERYGEIMTREEADLFSLKKGYLQPFSKTEQAIALKTRKELKEKIEKERKKNVNNEIFICPICGKSHLTPTSEQLCCIDKKREIGHYDSNKPIEEIKKTILKSKSRILKQKKLMKEDLKLTIEPTFVPRGSANNPDAGKRDLHYKIKEWGYIFPTKAQAEKYANEHIEKNGVIIKKK